MIRKIKQITLGLTAFVFVMAFNTMVHAKDVLVLETSKGTVEIEFLPNVAPKHVAQVSKLAKSGFYNGIVFHRVIEGFMAQTGDPTGTGSGGSKEPNINAEFSITPYYALALMFKSDENTSGDACPLHSRSCEAQHHGPL